MKIQPEKTVTFKGTDSKELVEFYGQQYDPSELVKNPEYTSLMASCIRDLSSFNHDLCLNAIKVIGEIGNKKAEKLLEPAHKHGYYSEIYGGNKIGLAATEAMKKLNPEDWGIWK